MYTIPTPDNKDTGKRKDAVNVVRGWLWGKTHLPKDLVEALRLLIPEIKEGENGWMDDV